MNIKEELTRNKQRQRQQAENFIETFIIPELLKVQNLSPTAKRFIIGFRHHGDEVMYGSPALKKPIILPGVQFSTVQMAASLAEKFGIQVDIDNSSMMPYIAFFVDNVD